MRAWEAGRMEAGNLDTPVLSSLNEAFDAASVGEEENMPLFLCGPSGGLGGLSYDWRNYSDPTYDLNDLLILNIFVRHGRLIDYIRFDYQSISDPNKRYSRIMGGGGGHNRDAITLERAEVVTRIFGRYGIYVDSISIEKTNIDTGEQNTFGPFGGPGGSAGFDYRVPLLPTRLPPPYPPPQKGPWADMAIIGLWGGRGIFVDALGVIMRR
jgi:hypothetical protein